MWMPGAGICLPFGGPALGPDRRQLQGWPQGPVGCEITGCALTPDGRTMFINVQHPGSGAPRNGSNPRRFSNWPDFHPAGRPRSSTVVVRRVDGGVIGA